MPPDRFGLPRFTLLGETDDERAARIEQVNSLIQSLFKEVCYQLGTDEAIRVWSKVAQKKRGRKPRKRRKPEEARLLLALYDNLFAEQPNEAATIPRRIGETLEKNERGRFGTDAKSIEKMVRRLVIDRKRQVQEAMQEVESIRRVIGAFSAAAGKGHK